MPAISVKVTRRGRLPTDKEMKAAIVRAIDEEGQAVKEDYDKTVATWKNKPSFVIEKRTTANPMTLTVRPAKGRKTTEIYGYVDQGTRPHIITPKRAKTLAFMTPSSPKTRPGYIGSGSGSRGNTAVFTKMVRHPGTKPRKFSSTIQKLSRARFKVRLKTAIASAAKGKK